MTRTIQRILICTAALFLISGGVPTFAQPAETFDQTQIITGDRTLTVDKAFKITETPNTIDIPVKMDNIRYELLPKRPAITIQPALLEPARIKIREPLEPLYKGFIKGGVGTYLTPFLEAYYTSVRNRDLAYGAHIKHLSAIDGINGDIAFSGFSQNQAEVWAKKIYNKHSLQSKFAYERDVWHYYGFDPQDQEIDKKDYRQKFNEFSLDNKWKSYYTDSSKVNHDINLNVYHLSDAYDAQELGIAALADLRAYRGAHAYVMNTGFDFISYKSDPLSPFEFMNDTAGTVTLPVDMANAIVYAVPKIDLRTGQLRFLAGLGLYGQFSNQARFHAFPDIEVSYSLFGNMFIPYAAITGSVERNSFKTITDNNPFVLSQLELENSIVRYNVFGGIRGSVSDRISFNTSIGIDKTDNRPLYVNDTLLSVQNRFKVVYDEVNTFTMMGEITYQNNKKWNGGARLEIFSYTADVEDKAWHLPTYRLSLNAHYNLFDKLELGADAALIGKRDVKSYFAPSPDAQEQAGRYYLVELKPYFDLTLTAMYRYTARLSAFVEAYNLTATKYDIYYRFPAQRAFVIGGIKYAF